MAKLPKDTAEAVAGAELPGDGYSLIPDGKYVLTLSDVKSLPAKEKGKFPQWETHWTVEYLVGEDGEPDDASDKGRQLRRWLSLSPKDYPKQLLKEFFSAFDVTPDADTDDFVGEQCVGIIGHEIPTQGKLAGREVNLIDKLFSLSTLGEEPQGEEPF